jgi:hypothetical protein
LSEQDTETDKFLSFQLVIILTFCHHFKLRIDWDILVKYLIGSRLESLTSFLAGVGFFLSSPLYADISLRPNTVSDLMLFLLD